MRGAWVLVASFACRQVTPEASVSRTPTRDAAAGDAAPPSAPILTSTSPSTLLPAILVKPSEVSLQLSAGSRLGPDGWLTMSEVNSHAYDLRSLPTRGASVTVAHPRSGLPHFVATKAHALVAYEAEDTSPAEVFSFHKNHRSVTRFAGAPATWAFDLGGTQVLLIGTHGGAASREGRWHASVVDDSGLRVVASATRPESVWGAATLGDGYVLALREPITMAGATQVEKAAAIAAAVQGDGTRAAALAGPTHGALLYLDKNGHITNREAYGPQRPAGLASTTHGWLVVLGEGTLAKGLRDATLQVRAPNAPLFQTILSNLDSPSGLRQRGNWSCLTELPTEFRGEMYVVHCVDPERNLHIATPPIAGIVSVLDIEGTSRVFLYQYRYKGDPQVLALTLP